MSVSDRPVSDLPDGFDWGYVTGRIIHALADTKSDPDKEPEARGASGRVVFAPRPKPSSVNGVLVVYERTVVQLNDDGYLVDAHGDQLPIALLSGDYSVTFELASGLLDGFQIRVTPEHTAANPLDLATAAPYEPPTGVAVTTMLVPLNPTEGYVLGWMNGKLAWLPGSGGGGGGGVIANNTPTKPAEGQSASYLVSSAVTWPSGLVWSTDPDGGMAPTITGTALVSLFTVGGVTRAVMGSTFPMGTVPDPDPEPDPTDSTPPIVGSMTASAINHAGFTLTVSGASDAVALHATPYAFTTNGGSTWSAYQSSPIYVASGLTQATGYSCNWRVRDAAGNVSTGTAQTVTTGTSAPTVSFTDYAMTDERLESTPRTYTFTGVDIGPASTGRVVIVGAVSRGGHNKTLVSVTVGGVAATIAGHGVSPEGNDAGFADATVPTGTTADVIITYATDEAAVTRCAIGVWTAPAPIVVGDFGYGNHSTTLSTEVGDDIMAIGLWWTANATTWTGATEEFLTDVIPTTSRAGGATAVASSTSHTVSFTNTSIDAIAALAVRQSA